MRKYVPRVLLWLFVINLGTAFGAGIYESRVVVPQWQNTPPQTWPNTGLHFWVYVTTVPLTLLTIANLVAAWRDRWPRRILVAGRILDQRRGADLDLLVLHSDDNPADGHRGPARSGSPGSPVAMAASGLQSSCSHAGGVVGSAEGVLVARRAQEPTLRSRARRSALSGAQGEEAGI
jgi:hypothetical protein